MMPESRPVILFVKKLFADGEACAKCRDVERRLRRDALMHHVGDIVVAREGDPESPGAVLADRHGVQRAPFFVVRHPDGSEQIIESYLAFKRWFASGEATAGDLAEAVDRHPDLAFI